MTIKICYEYKSCFSCLYLWILERVGQRGITSFNYWTITMAWYKIMLSDIKELEGKGENQYTTQL